MTKIFLFDADGVVLKPRDKFFSERFSQEFGVPMEKTLPFFKGENKDVMVGRADLKEVLSKYLGEWGWTGTVEELLEYWFSNENKIDLDVLSLVATLRTKGYKCYIVSDHSAYRADDLMNTLGLAKYFDGSFFSGKVGYTKEEKEFFETVLKNLNASANEVTYIDDDPKNIEVAEELGIKGHVFKDINDLERVLELGGEKMCR